MYGNIIGFVWFGLVSLFNSMSTFVGYLMPKLFSKKNSSGSIKPIAGRIRGFIPLQSERNNATGVRTRLLRFRSPSL